MGPAKSRRQGIDAEEPSMERLPHIKPATQGINYWQ
jgi:hypothetical protein